MYGKVKAVLKVIFLMKIYYVLGGEWYIYNKYFELNNSNYLLAMVSTFVMPFNIPLSTRMTQGCTMQK